MLTLAAFIVAIGVLITIHEFGHYRVAVACGVKVQRFGICTFPVAAPEGPGAALGHRIAWWLTKPVLEWQPKNQKRGQETTFAVGLFPLAGYVQMLGQNGEKELPAAQATGDFRTKSVWQRFAIVAAGPAANLLLAVLLYAGVNWYGVQEAKPVLARPIAGSVAAHAGLAGGELVTAAGFEGSDLQPIASFEDLNWILVRGALDRRDVRLVSEQAGRRSETLLPLSTLEAREADEKLVRMIGIGGPWSAPVMGEVFAGGAASEAGLREGDVVRQVGTQPIADSLQLRELIRRSVVDGRPQAATWTIERAGRTLGIEVRPRPFTDGTQVVGRIEAVVGARPALVTVRHGFVEGLTRGVTRTWETSAFTLRMMGKMLTGDLSVKSLSGPITIAEYAGKSASVGPAYFLLFLAALSVSLGVLNLLPIPMLDGGHLMYYLWEGATGKSVSDAWMEYLQRAGMAVLLVTMSVALFNDVARQVTRFFG